MCVSLGWLCGGTKVEEAADAPPHFGEPVRLENQKADDQQAEDDGAHRREEDRELRVVGQKVEHELEQLGHHGHEHRAQDAAKDGAHSTDDDGREEEDRHQQRKALGRDHAKEVGPQPPGHAGIERRQTERQQFVAQQRDAQHLGRDVAVADGDEGAADARSEKVGRAQQHQEGDWHDQPVEAERGLQRQAEQARRRHAQAAGAAREFEVGEQEVRNERGCDGGDGQVKALDAQRGNAHHDAAEHGHDATRQDVDQKGRTHLGLEDGHGVRAQAHEGGLSQAHKAGIAGEDVEPRGAGHIDADQAGQVEPVVAGHEGKQHEQGGGHDQPGLLRARVEQRRVGDVGFLEGADAHQSRSISCVPKRP
jgi:hypothetical protein